MTGSFDKLAETLFSCKCLWFSAFILTPYSYGYSHITLLTACQLNNFSLVFGDFFVSRVYGGEPYVYFFFFYEFAPRCIQQFLIWGFKRYNNHYLRHSKIMNFKYAHTKKWCSVYFLCSIEGCRQFLNCISQKISR